jgi:hypothetical protein
MAMASQDHCLSAARWLAFTAPGVVHHPDPETRMGESASEIAAHVAAAAAEQRRGGRTLH